MKAALILAIVVLSVVAIRPDPEREHFLAFIQKYGKNYAHDELDQRFANFKASLQRIAEKTKNSKGASYGITKFSDMTPEEFKSKILMKNPIDPSQKRQDVGVLVPKVTDVPSSFDWRPKGAVTPVKDQGQCGSCWAFSVTENIESMWIIAGKGKNSTVDLAPQQIVDCDTTDAGCDGGDPPSAYDYVISAGGMDDEAHYPYVAEDENCMFKSQYVQAKISTWKYATSDYSETTLQQNLVSWGPLSVCVDASNWQDYTGGVMTWEECAWINLLDHCVQLVGYDTTGNYWIVRNSWGTDWGESGYIRLEMGSDTCGIAHEATSSVV